MQIPAQKRALTFRTKDTVQNWYETVSLNTIRLPQFKSHRKVTFLKTERNHENYQYDWAVLAIAQM